jgi:hypothetical protein
MSVQEAQEKTSRVMQLSRVWPLLQVAVLVHWLVEVPPLLPPPVLLPKPLPPLLLPEPPIMMVEVQACAHPPVTRHCSDDATQESHAGDSVDWQPWRQLESPGLQAQ